MDPSLAQGSSTHPRARRFSARLVVAALAFGAAGCAATGSIRGILSIAPPAGRADSAIVARDTTGAHFASITNAVVYLERDAEAKPGLGRRQECALVRETRSGFEPRVIAIRAGTTVTFENRDTIYHDAFSVATAKRFNTGLCAPRQQRQVVFDRAGIVDVFCEIHPHAVGFVLVRPDRLFARPNASGEFHLPRLAGGTYTIKVWHPIYGETSQRVSVPRKARTIVRLTL